MKKWRTFFYGTFGFTFREFQGFSLLILLASILVLSSFAWHFVAPPPAVSSADAELLDSLVAHLKATEVQNSTAARGGAQPFRPAERLFSFDPNTLSVAEWETLGVPRYIAERIGRYLSKGGRFRVKKDLAEIYDFDLTKYAELEAYIALPDKIAASGSEKNEARAAFRPAERLFSFDPNTLSVAEWETLGVPRYIAERIGRYLSKGGRFRVKKDVAEIYDFDSAKYVELKPFIDLPEAKDEAPPRENRLTRFDLNTADTAQLKRVRGIGTGYAARIVKLRQELGGFHSLEQVRDEVYRFPDETFAELAKYAYVTSSPELRKININTADVETLQSHRYLRYKQAQVIVRYRINHGAFRDADDLRKVRALPPALIDKLLPYLTF